MSDDLVAFLRARLDEDEAVALSHPDDAYEKFIPSLVATEETGYPALPYLRIAKARVLAEVDAKRRILDTYVEAIAFYDAAANRHHPAGEVHGLRTAVHLLTLPYADHPDYRDEWRP